MATKAEQFHSEEMRRNHGYKAPTSKKKPKKAFWSRERTHAAVKATHAIEETSRRRRPSRESTRGSANRAKADSALNITEEATQSSPESRARRSRARGTKVRGRAH